MMMEGECLADIEVFVGAEYGYEVSAEIVGERGTALTSQPGAAIVRSQRARSEAVSIDWLERFRDAYVAELTQWANSVNTGEPFSGASAWDGYMALLVTDACVQALHSRAPVRLAAPPRPDLYAP
jgi:myo-inositol 2-dehydrogenase/D-chiro-inositol 1-dehydrogenase